jgi:hypothetical protein
MQLRCDDATLETLTEMELIEIKAHKNQDYELLSQLAKDLTIVREVSFDSHYKLYIGFKIYDLRNHL